MPYIPPQGTAGVIPGRDPTLIPNFDRVAVSGQGSLDHQNPAAFLAANPRVDATVQATVTGTITNLDVVTITATTGLLPGGAASVTYTVVTADTTTTIAEGIANAINTSSVMQSVGIYATLVGTATPNAVLVRSNGPCGNFLTMSSSVSGAATEIITWANSGKAAGGSGPVFATNNFNFNFATGGVGSFFYGQPYILGYDVLLQMIAQGMPIE
jgi:phage tail sheath gpL-like